MEDSHDPSKRRMDQRGRPREILFADRHSPCARYCRASHRLPIAVQAQGQAGLGQAEMNDIVNHSHDGKTEYLTVVGIPTSHRIFSTLTTSGGFS